MSLGTKEYVSQTYVPWVDFWLLRGASVGAEGHGPDTSITRVKGKPARLLSFEHTIRATSQTGGGASTWKLELFDEEWTAIEEEIFTEVPEEDQEGDEVRWCEWKYFYVDNEGNIKEPTASNIFQGLVTSCIPTFTTHGVQLSIEGAELSIESEKRTKVGYFKKKSWFSWGNTMRIDEIVLDIIDKNKFRNWVPGNIEPTEEVLDVSDFWHTEPQGCTFNNERMPIQQFIKRELEPRAVSVLTGKAGYVFNLDDQTQPGVVLCHFKPENIEPGESDSLGGLTNPREFHYIRGDKNREVISFSPEIEGAALAAMKKSNKIAIVVTAPDTKNVNTVVVDDAETPEKTLYNDKGQKHHDKDPTAQARVLHKTARTKKEAKAIAKGWFYSHWVRNYQATLEIVGDARIKPQNMIRVFVHLPDGTLHYTSGGYIVFEVTHRISPGTWVTSMSLGRGTAAKGYKATGNPATWG